MDAVICDNTKYQSLFTQTELGEAHRRPEKLNYSEKEKNHG